MDDPVILESGQTYERDAIQQWFNSGKETDPVTNKKLKSKNMITNYSLRNSIDAYKQNSKIRPSNGKKNSFYPPYNPYV
jgi:hypothetical protein